MQIDADRALRQRRDQPGQIARLLAARLRGQPRTNALAVRAQRRERLDQPAESRIVRLLRHPADAIDHHTAAQIDANRIAACVASTRRSKSSGSS